jgi:hypothetical protein
MACSKYNLTNTGSTLVNFNYRRCDDSLWEYQVELNPNQTKNIWLINNTYSIASSFSNTVVLINEGVFPSISASQTPTPTQTSTPTQTPTPSVTATNTSTPTQTPTNTETPTNTPTPTNTETPTNTPTPTNTETPTPTPTNTETPTPTPTQSRFSFSVYSGVTSDEACGQYNLTSTIYGDKSIFDENTIFYDILVGPTTIDMTGYYNYSQTVVELDINGNTGIFNLCTTLTPTPTNTGTPTQTPTNTPSPTPTFAYYTYSLGTGATSNDSCTNFSSSPVTIYGSVAGGIGPNVGETLYETSGIPLTDTVPDGYYSNGTDWFLVTGGSGLVTSSDPNGCI